MTTTPNLIPASAAADASLQAVGGKGRQLGLMQRYGLPVPDFFVIPAVWSKQRQGGIPETLSGLLAAELEKRGWLDLPLAVRSSAVGEDGAKASFAGIYHSSLNICGLEALTVAVAEVWASLDSARAQAYRQGLELGGEPGMAVIIMPLLAAEASGIAFTCDPISGRDDRIVVHAQWGLGETLVAGEAVGDEYIFAEDRSDTWRLLSTRCGSKTTMAVPAAEGGTRRQTVDTARAQSSVLSPEQAETLAALLRDAALAFDFTAPFYDVEWVWDGEQFWLTQARPVTRRPHFTYTELSSQAVLWTRGNTCEVMPDPLQAMDWNFSRRGCNDLLEQGWKLCAFPLQAGVQRAGLFHGRLYLEATILQWEAWASIGLPPARFNALLGGHQPAIPVEPPTWRARLSRLGRMLNYLRRAPAMARRGEAEIEQAHQIARELRTTPLPESNAEISGLLHRVLKPARESAGLFFLQGSGGGSLSLLLDTLEQAFPGEGEAMGAALLAGGEPSVTAQQSYALVELARMTHSPTEAQDGTADTEFSRAFAAFLARYGHRGHDETYLRSPRWDERPGLLLEQLPSLAQVDLAQIRRRQKGASDAAWARIRRELPFWRRPVIQAQIKAANRDSNRREAARSAMIALLAAGRHLWLMIGQRLLNEGVLDQAEDIFHLLPSEVERHAFGRLSTTGLRARLAQRRASFASWQLETAPEWFSPNSKQNPSPAQVRHPEQPGQAYAGEILRGIATGTGTARGKVRRLRHPSEGSALQAGEILLAPSTDPGWTPLFLKAGGLIVETGGYMSHGAIVAREFALPTVVNLPTVFDRLQDGDEVEVDGLRGEVRKK